MGIRKDLTGMRFGRLVAISCKMDSNNRRCIWVCRCDCGATKEVKSSELTAGKVKSCGCLHKEIVGNMSRTHGKSKTRLYKIWRAILTRCNNPNYKRYNDYGGRGIKVCDEWSNDYPAFEKWAFENGYNQNAKYMECTIDRIDVNGDYSPQNCRWISNVEQANNTRKVSKFSIDGVEKTLTDWCKIYAIPKQNVQARLKLGWDFKRAITTPVRKCKNSKNKNGGDKQ